MKRRLRRLPAAAALVLTAAAAACSAASHGPTREVIAPAGGATLAAYSPAVRSGGLVFLSGQIGLLPGTRELAPGGIVPETRQTLENIRVLLATAGLTPADLVKCTVFLADIAEYEAMNAIYAAFFDASPPARSALGVAGLPLAARVEIECIAGAPR
jgi:2-iminobutanoate/2-iminopropanoate deaminase